MTRNIDRRLQQDEKKHLTLWRRNITDLCPVIHKLSLGYCVMKKSAQFWIAHSQADNEMCVVVSIHTWRVGRPSRREIQTFVQRQLKHQSSVISPHEKKNGKKEKGLREQVRWMGELQQLKQKCDTVYKCRNEGWQMDRLLSRNRVWMRAEKWAKERPGGQRKKTQGGEYPSEETRRKEIKMSEGETMEYLVCIARTAGQRLFVSSWGGRREGQQSHFIDSPPRATNMCYVHQVRKLKF